MSETRRQTAEGVRILNRIRKLLITGMCQDDGVTVDVAVDDADTLLAALLAPPAAPPQESGRGREPAGWISVCADEDCDADAIYAHRPPDPAVECECGRVLEWEPLDRRTATRPQEIGRPDELVAALAPIAAVGAYMYATDKPDDTVLAEIRGAPSGGVFGLTRGDFKAVYRAASRLAQPEGVRDKHDPGEIRFLCTGCGGWFAEVEVTSPAGEYHCGPTYPVPIGLIDHVIALQEARRALAEREEVEDG